MNQYADYFISLIGTNPLPAFITALKDCNKNTKITLVHTDSSENNIGSRKVAENLRNVILQKIPKADVKLLECDKSDTKKINNCVSQLIKSIIQDIKNEDSSYKKRLMLDYSSGTKVMSAIFTERLINIETDSLYTIISYVDDSERKILQNSKNISGYSKFLIKNVVNKFNLSVEDITKIHGYSIATSEIKEKLFENNIKCLESLEPIFFVNDLGNKIKVDAAYLLNGRLIICFKSKYKNKKKKDYKFELFQIKDIANKLGGNRSEIIYQSDCDEDMQLELSKDLKRAYEYERDKRLKFIYINETFKEQIRKQYKTEGGN